MRQQLQRIIKLYIEGSARAEVMARALVSPAMLENLLTEQRNPESVAIDAMHTEQMLRVINAEDQKVAAAVAREIPHIARAIDSISGRLAEGGRLFYIGAGTSGRLGVLDASECPPTFSVSPELVQGIIAGGERALSRSTEASEDDAPAGAAEIRSRLFCSKDVLVGIAASGRTPFVLGAIAEARRMGALTGGISCTPDSELSRAVDLPIEVLAGPEILTGSTRLKAGTATKLVLNMLSTGVMIRLGHVFGNLMINVQPTNDKLLDRARRIVSAANEIPLEQAAELLEEGGSVKTAILMGRLALGAQDARALLARAGGNINKALVYGKAAG